MDCLGSYGTLSETCMAKEGNLLVSPTIFQVSESCISRLLVAKARATLITNIFRLSLGRNFVLFLTILLSSNLLGNTLPGMKLLQKSLCVWKQVWTTKLTSQSRIQCEFVKLLIGVVVQMWVPAVEFIFSKHML